MILRTSDRSETVECSCLEVIDGVTYAGCLFWMIEWKECLKFIWCHWLSEHFEWQFAGRLTDDWYLIVADCFLPVQLQSKSFLFRKKSSTTRIHSSSNSTINQHLAPLIMVPIVCRHESLIFHRFLELPRMPKIYFQVASQDGWGRHRTEGYTYLDIPSQPGERSERLIIRREQAFSPRILQRALVLLATTRRLDLQRTPAILHRWIAWTGRY